jgi:hypothetical protein
MSKIKDEWKLPLPDIEDDEYVWLPVVRIGNTIPWGYEQDPNDPDILLPIPEKLELMEQAKKFLKQYSYRDVAAWLSTQSGEYISHTGFYKRVKLEQRRKTEASQQRYLAKRYKEALEKAEKLENQRIGARARKDSRDS